MMVVADRLQLDSGLLRQRLAELSSSPNSATPPPTADGLPPIPQPELTAIRLASQTDDRRDLWWLDPLLYADPRARSVALALRHAATVAEAFENLEDKDRPALLVAATDARPRRRPRRDRGPARRSRHRTSHLEPRLDNSRGHQPDHCAAPAATTPAPRQHPRPRSPGCLRTAKYPLVVRPLTGPALSTRRMSTHVARLREANHDRRGS